MVLNEKSVVEYLKVIVSGKSFDSLLLIGILLIVIGIIFLIICVVLMRKETSENSDKLLDEVIENEVVSMKRNDELLSIASDNLNNYKIGNIEKVIIDEFKEESPVSEVNIIDRQEIPVIKIESNVLEGLDFPIVEPKEIKSNIVTNSMEEYEVDLQDKVDNKSDEFIENNEVECDDKYEIMPSKGTSLSVVEETSINAEKNDLENVVLEEVNDGVENESFVEEEYEKFDENDEIIKRDIDILMPESIELVVVTPKRGKEIGTEILDATEEIELL